MLAMPIMVGMAAPGGAYRSVSSISSMAASNMLYMADAPTTMSAPKKKSAGPGGSMRGMMQTLGNAFLGGGGGGGSGARAKRSSASGPADAYREYSLAKPVAAKPAAADVPDHGLYNAYGDESAGMAVDEMNSWLAQPPSAVRDEPAQSAAAKNNVDAGTTVADIVGILAALQDIDGGWPDLPSQLVDRFKKDLAAAGKPVPSGGKAAVHANTALAIAWLDLQAASPGTSDYVRQQIQPMMTLARSFK